MKTKESRFQVHDELTAPERSLPVLKGAVAGGGQLSNFLGVLAGAPAVLRAYARFRSEMRHGTLPLKSQQRTPGPPEWNRPLGSKHSSLHPVQHLLQHGDGRPAVSRSTRS